MVHASRAGWECIALYVLGAVMSAGSIDPCSSSTEPFSITTTEDARDLATALTCSGVGSFDVLWEGTVVVDQTIALTDGFTVIITGVGADAIADGGGTTALFTVRNATLNITDLRLENGYGSAVDVDYSYKKGGAIWVGGIDSVVSWSGTTTFHNNFAAYGGAVCIEDGARASGAGHTTFTQNTVDLDGGAVRLVDGALTLTGETLFFNNSAYSRGGAITASGSNISWSGVTSLENSTLTSGFEGGGAVDIQSSVLSWQGETYFIGGSGGNGGALLAQESNISWGGKSVFCDNIADLHGGGLSIQSSSNVSWTGETLFRNNRAGGPFDNGYGGALHVADSNVSWNGATNFTNNSAGSGGGLYGDGSTSMVWSGNTLFSRNAAATGGAVYAGDGTNMNWGGIITFVENTARANGGAVALNTEVLLNLAAVGVNILLTGNEAGVAGGAVYQSGTPYGVTWKGASFVSNSALNGGGVYSVSSGTVIEAGAEFPNVYVNCAFLNNTAEASGGAIESAAGKDNFTDSTFEGNTARALGGGLRLAGTTTLTRCDFVGNGANEAGPAVASLGTITVVDSSFADNSLICASGMFLNYTIEEGEMPKQRADNYYYSVCDGCDACLEECPVDGNGTQGCITALENTKSNGTDAEGVPITLETLTIMPGYWRSVAASWTILSCWNEEACLGGVTDNADFCESGYKGPYCAICADGYAATLAYTCSDCSSGGGVAFTVFALLAALAVVAAVIVYLVSTNDDTKTTRFRRLTHGLPVQGLKTVLVAWQILTQFDSVANVTYAGAYGQFLDGIASIVSLDLGLVLSAGCMVTTDFHDRLIIYTLGPLLALGALGVSFQLATRRNHGSEEAIRTVQRKHFSMALLMTFLVYSSVSSTVFRMFACETLDGGKVYLRADYTIECTMDKHKALEVYAGFMIMVYPVGIPVVYAIILFKHREALQDKRRRSLQQSAGMQVTADLWKPYKPSKYYYEVVECARRVMLTGIVVFIYPNTAAQVAVTLVLAFVFVMVSESLAPYASKQDSWLSRVAHIVVFLSMFQALLVKVDVSGEDSDSQEVFGGVLLAANLCMAGAVIVEATMVIYFACSSGYTDFDESVAPGARNTTSTSSVIDSWDMVEGANAPTSVGTTSLNLA